MKLVAKRAHKFIGKIDLIVTSPYVRAKQTADVLVNEFPAKIMEFKYLEPESSFDDFIDWFKTLPKKYKSVAIVGHEPHLSGLASYLLTGNSKPVMELKKSGLACLEINSHRDLIPGSMTLKWLVQPRILTDRSC